MQVWQEGGKPREGIDLFLGEDLLVDGDALYIEGRQVGRRVDVADAQGQSKARAMAGSVEWILLDLGEWKMIPIENIIAACDGGPTKVAVKISSAEQVLGAAFALQIGVDALLVPEAVIDTALIAKSQRGEVIKPQLKVESEDFALTEFEVIEIREGGVGDRVCVDLTSLLDVGEGMLVGSSASSMVLVHSETVESEFVPTRPFRVNAGAAHCYILMADSTTKYLSELEMGDEIMVVSQSGSKRMAIVGRTKIEKRPFILFKWRDKFNNVAGILLQQAETVRLVGPSKTLISITELAIGDSLKGWSGVAGRHIGVEIGADVVER